MLVITSKRELIDTLDARLTTLRNAQRTNAAAKRTLNERERLQGAIGELSLVRDILADAAINIVNLDVDRSIIAPRQPALARYGWPRVDDTK